MPLILVLFLATLASAYVCYTIAKERHADAQFWVWMGVLFGPLEKHFVYLTENKNLKSMDIWLDTFSF